MSSVFMNDEIENRTSTAFAREEFFSSGALSERALFRNSSRTPGPWAKVIDELLRIRTLEEDWDSEGSPAPDRVVCDQAIKICLALKSNGIAPPSRVSAGVNANIFLEWVAKDEYFEIEVASPFEYEYRLTIGSQMTSGKVAISNQ